jgi:hypothetical protein
LRRAGPDCGDYLIWVLSARRKALPPGGLDALASAELQTLALRLAAAWPPSLRDIIASKATLRLLNALPAVRDRVFT